MPNDQSIRAGGSRRLTVLSDAERVALYDLPDLDDFQRAEFFALTDAERGVADRRGGPSQRLHCLLQIGYFKAKHAFFTFDERDIPAEDVDFLRKRYFPGEEVELRPLRRRERYAQRAEIAELFGYNSMLLSTLLRRFRVAEDQRAIDRLRKISPVAWQHIYLSGRYVFRGQGKPIDLEAILQNIVLT